MSPIMRFKKTIYICLNVRERLVNIGKCPSLFKSSLYIYILATIWYLPLRNHIVGVSFQVEDNHLFGEDAEIAEGATEKIITGDRWVVVTKKMDWELFSTNFSRIYSRWIFIFL